MMCPTVVNMSQFKINVLISSRKFQIVPSTSLPELYRGLLHGGQNKVRGLLQMLINIDFTILMQNEVDLLGTV